MATRFAVAQPIGDVPPNTELDDFGLETPTAVDRVADDRSGQQRLHGEPSILRSHRQRTRTAGGDLYVLEYHYIYIG